MKPEQRSLKSKAELVGEVIRSMPDDCRRLKEAWDAGNLEGVKKSVKTFETHLVLIEDIVKEQLWVGLDNK